MRCIKCLKKYLYETQIIDFHFEVYALYKAHVQLNQHAHV